MSYSAVVGHEATIARLRTLARRRRVAHAYLFAGPSGVGKRLTAIAFARSLLCEKKGDEACEQCETCRRTGRGTHRDLKLVRREEDKKEITIDQVRETIRELSFVGEGPRAVVIDEAERMNEEAMNAFLKTFEEAPDRTVLVLVTSAPSMILPTLRSRCQTILFHALKEEEVLHVLNPSTPEAKLAAKLADGSAGRALELVEDLKEWGPESSELLDRIAAGDLNPIVEGLTKIRDQAKARQRALRILQIVALSIREKMRSAGPDVDDLARRIETLLDHAAMIERNANVPLVVEDALLRI